jgi:hypothetical protein
MSAIPKLITHPHSAGPPWLYMHRSATLLIFAEQARGDLESVQTE